MNRVMCTPQPSKYYRRILSTSGNSLENIMTFCADSCNLMMGLFNSVLRNLPSMIPGLLIKKCNCHIGYWSAKNAFQNSPPGVQSVIFDAPKYIRAGNGARLVRRQHFQRRAKFEEVVMLKLTLLRWLVTGKCTRRVLRQRSLLIIYFRRELEYYRSPREGELVALTSYLLTWMILRFIVICNLWDLHWSSKNI